MKITMLGGIGCGKTTYLSTMLRLLYNGAVKGLTINTEDYKRAARLISTIDQLSKGKFPMATSQAGTEIGNVGENFDNLSFSLNKGESKLLDFDFMDYAGGLLSNIAKGEDEDTNEQLIDKLLTSDVVLIFVDAIKLKECKSDIVARHYLDVDYINQIIQRAQQKAKEDNKEVKIIFAMTKCDASIILENDIPALKNKLISVYSKLFSYSSYPIYAIETIGRGNVATTTSWKGKMLSTNNVIQNLDFKPKNIISILAEAFLLCLNNLEQEIQELSDTIQTMEQQLKGPRRLIDKAFNKGKLNNIYNNRKVELNDKNLQLMNLQKSRTIMRSIIKESL